MMTKDDMPPGSLVRVATALAEAALLLVAPPFWCKPDAVGLLVAFDHWGRRNSDLGDPIVLWAGHHEVRMSSTALVRILDTPLTQNT